MRVSVLQSSEASELEIVRLNPCSEDMSQLVVRRWHTTSCGRNAASVIGRPNARWSPQDALRHRLLQLKGNNIPMMTRPNSKSCPKI